MGTARLRDANALTTQILVGRGIRVTQRGSAAYVVPDPATNEPAHLNIPFLPEDAPQGLVEAVQGYIDHEAGHVLYTDWVVRAAAVAEGLAWSHNLVEDCYVERAMAHAFPGSSENLGKLHAFFVTEITPGLLREADGDEALAFGALIVPAVRALAGQEAFARFMDEGGHWGRRGIATFLAAFGHDGRDGLRRARSSADCLDVARLLDVAVRQARAAIATLPPTEAAGWRTAASAGAEAAGSGSAAPGDGVGLDRVRQALPEEETEGDAVEPASVAAGRRGGSMPGAAGAGEVGAASRRSTPSPTGAERGGAASAGPGALTADPFSSAVARAISERAEVAVANSSYRVWTRDLDLVEPLPVCAEYDEGWLVALDDAVSEAVGVLQRRFERAMAARHAARSLTGLRSGRLDAGSLHKVATGDDRVFRRRQEAPATDSALSLLVDNSGSMFGDKMWLAMMAGYALTRTAERARIACECMGFTTREWSTGLARFETASPGGLPYSRWEPLYLPIYKAFAEPFGPTVRRRFAAAARWQWFCSGNVDGESVALAATRLSARRETRKVLIVISDGHPASGPPDEVRAHLHATVEAVERSGIELVGIGIGDDAVRTYYPRSLVLEDIGDLPAALMDELGRMAGLGGASRVADRGSEFRRSRGRHGGR